MMHFYRQTHIHIQSEKQTDRQADTPTETDTQSQGSFTVNK